MQLICKEIRLNEIVGYNERQTNREDVNGYEKEN